MSSQQVPRETIPYENSRAQRSACIILSFYEDAFKNVSMEICRVSFPSQHIFPFGAISDVEAKTDIVHTMIRFQVSLSI